MKFINSLETSIENLYYLLIILPELLEVSVRMGYLPTRAQS